MAPIFKLKGLSKYSRYNILKIIPKLHINYLGNNTINITNEDVITNIEHIPDQYYDKINIDEDHDSKNVYFDQCISEIKHHSSLNNISE